MKIAFFSEAGYQGKVSRDNPNMRTDVAWVCALDATHHPIVKLRSLPDNLYDVGVMILPKNRKPLLDWFPNSVLEEYRRVCKKVTIMQESYYNYWQDSPIAEQIWYFNFITEMDLIFCHNDVDLKYYNGLTNVRTELLPSVMITDDVVRRSEWGNGVIIGGNWVWAYGGFDSYQVALELSESDINEDIVAVTTGRMLESERHYLKHLPWMMWSEWIKTLSQFNVGIQLGTASAGTFNLNCSFHGIPCIGYDQVNPQKDLHPQTTIVEGDLNKGIELAIRLKGDVAFYEQCSRETRRLFEQKYSEKVFVQKTMEILESL